MLSDPLQSQPTKTKFHVNQDHQFSNPSTNVINPLYFRKRASPLLRNSYSSTYATDLSVTRTTSCLLRCCYQGDQFDAEEHIHVFQNMKLAIQYPSHLAVSDSIIACAIT